MNEETNRVQIEILGERYVLRGEASSEYIRRMAGEVGRRLQEITKRYSQISSTKAAVLVAINLADELNHLQDSYDSLVKMIETEKVK